jgi:VWFA-related protein
MCRKFAMLCVVAFSVSAAAQDTPTFKSKSELVLVPAVVTKHGQPVRGLRKEDFVLLHDGEPQTIATFEEIEKTASPEGLLLPPNTVQNYASKTQGDVVIMVLDLTKGGSSNARIHSYIGDICRYFAQSRTPISVLLLTSTGLQQIHSFSSSPDDLTKVVDSWISKSPPVSTDSPESTSGQIAEYVDRIRFQPRDMDDPITTIAQAYRGIGGRKKLIWISTDFIKAPSFSLMLSGDAALRGFQAMDKAENAWKAMSDANIAVYPIDINGVTNPLWDTGGWKPLWTGGDAPISQGQTATNFGAASSGPRFNNLFGNALSQSAPSENSLLRVAQKTGGKNCTDLPSRCVARIDADAQHYYLLGFYLTSASHPGWHQLKVKGAEQRYSIRARNGFMVMPATENAMVVKVLAPEHGKKRSTEPATLKMDTTRVALASPVDYTSVPLRFQWTKKAQEGQNTQIELALSSPVGGVLLEPEGKGLDLEVLAFIRATNGKSGEVVPDHVRRKLSAQQQDQFASGGFTYRKKMVFAPGRYEVRMLLRDNISQKIGTVSTVIDLTRGTTDISLPK